MLRFKKPKLKNSLRKREKLDLDALEAEAVASGLGPEDLGSQNDHRRQVMREGQERSEVEKQSNPYRAALARADEACRLLEMEFVQRIDVEEDGNMVFVDDVDDLCMSLDRARKLALHKQDKARLGPQAVAHLATSTTSHTSGDDKNSDGAGTPENKVVFTKMGQFVSGLQLNEDACKIERKDVLVDGDEPLKAPVEQIQEEPGGWPQAKDASHSSDIKCDGTLHEVAVGKGLFGAFILLQERGTLKKMVKWSGRNMDKKRCKLVGIVDDDEGDIERLKDIRIERTDESGRSLTAKEAFRLFFHKFHGKGPGKMRQEKRIKQLQEELKLKRMKN